MRKWLPLTAICAGTMLLLIDVTIVNVALPSLAADLRTSFSSLQWVVDAYALVLAALVLGAGSVADRIGHRRAFTAGLVVFALSSLACGFAPGPGLLVAARAVQGAGAAAMFATTFPLINSCYAGRDRGTAYGIWGAVAGAAAAVGPVLGGLLTQDLSWRFIFFVNPPIAVAVLAMTRTIIRPPSRGPAARTDVPGILALTAAAAAATYGMIRAGENGWGAPGSWGLLAAAAVLLVIFAVIETRTVAPMLDLRLLRSPLFSGMLAIGLVLNFTAFAYLTYSSIWLQSVLGLTPIDAGLVSLPMSVVAFAVSAFSGRALHNASPGLVTGAGTVIIGAGALVSLVLVHGAAGWPALMAGFAVTGVGVGLVSPMLGAATMSAVLVQRAGMAGGAVNMMRQLGYAFGVALLGTVFAARAGAALHARGVPGSAGLGRALAGGQAQVVVRAQAARQGSGAAAALSQALHAAAVTGLRADFLVAGIAGIVVGLAVLALVRAPAAAARPPADQVPKPAADLSA